MGTNGCHELRRIYPDGSFIIAWPEESDGPNRHPTLYIQWRDASNRPKHQPLELGLHVAADILEQLAAFARESVFEVDKQPVA